MDAELQAASAFLSSYLPLSAPVPMFTRSLHSLLSVRYTNHWHPSNPERGSAFRSVVRSDSTLDAVLVAAAHEASIGQAELRSALSANKGRGLKLGERWTLWIDPGCVSLRVEKDRHAMAADGFVASARESTLIEIYGRLPASLGALRDKAIPLEQALASSLSISTTPPIAPAPAPGAGTPVSSSTPGKALPDLSHSPVKRSSKAIAIRAPSGHQRPASPASVALLPPLPILSSPFVTPPTPSRPSSAGDVFSPSPSPPSVDFPSSGESSSTLKLGGIRRSSSRSSSGSSLGDSSDLDDGLFSSCESVTSSIASSQGTLWPATPSGAEEFKIPPLPMRSRTPSQTGFSFPPRSHSSASNHVPASPHRSRGTDGQRSAPSSPSKPRRRGTRGGGGGQHSHSGSNVSLSGGHEPSSSISSLSSLLSAAVNKTPATPNNTVKEYSGAKVGVLSGGVLLGLAGAGSMGSARGEVVGEAKRRGRDRRRVQPKLLVGRECTGAMWPPVSPAQAQVV